MSIPRSAIVAAPLLAACVIMTGALSTRGGACHSNGVERKRPPNALGKPGNFPPKISFAAV